jgi:hypothetical protein
MSSTDDNDRGGTGTGAGRAPSAERERQRRRIWRTTRALAVGGVAATAAFVLAAAHGSARATPGDDAISDDTGAAIPLTGGDSSGDAWDDGSSLAPSQSTPTPSYAPPVTHSGSS